MAAQQDQSAGPMNPLKPRVSDQVPAFDGNRRQPHDYSELAGQRIKPLIGAFLVGDVLQKKRS